MIDGKELHSGELVQEYANLEDFNRFKRLIVTALKASGYKVMMDCNFEDSSYFITFSKLNKSIRYELIKS